MEPSAQDHQTPVRERQDVDLGTVLYKIGQFINKASRLIAEFFVAFFRFSMIVLIYLRKNVWWIVAGSVIGLGYGLYRNYTSGIKYTSTSTVKMNFESTRYLYSTIDYLNAARGKGDLTTLSRIFNISPKEASSILQFEAAPMVNDLSVIEIYKEKIGLKKRFGDIESIGVDSFWVKMFKFEDIKKQLTRYDYPMHEITATCADASVFPKLQDGFVRLVSQNEALRRNQSIYQDIAKEENKILETSLMQLDSLSSSYTKKIAQSENAGSGSTSMAILDNDKSSNKFPELELHSTKLALSKELTALRIKSVAEQDIIQVYSPFNPMGNAQASFNLNYFRSVLNGVLLSVAILLIIAVLRYFNKLEYSSFKGNKN